MRWTIGMLLALVFMVATLSAPAAAQGQISLAAQAGFAGLGKVGTYVPVTVALTNQGESASGDIVVRTRDLNGFGVEYAMPTEVAQGAKKEVCFYVPMNEMSRNIEVVFVPKGGSGNAAEITAKAQISALPFNEVVIGVLANDEATLVHVGAVRLDNPPRSVHIIPLALSTLPDQQLALNNFDVLVINDFDTRRLTEAQLNAIRGWLAEGGALVIGGGPAWRKTLAGIPDEILPADITGTVQVNDLQALAALGGHPFQVVTPFAVNTGTLREGATGATEGERIGLARRRYGDGQTIFFGLDLALDPIAAWRGNPILWKDLISSFVPQGAEAELQLKLSQRMMHYRGGLANALRNIPALDLPPVWVLALILVGYVVIVGPLNYLVLRRYDRRDWGWLSIPAVALLVIGGVYVGAFKLKGREVMANEIAVVTLRPELKLQKVESYVGVFSPTRNDYRISLPGNPLVTNIPSYDGIYYDPQLDGDQPLLIMRVTYGTRTDVQFTNMSNWSLRSFAMQRYEAAAGGIAANLHGEGDRVAGTVTNQTDYLLKDCYIITQYGLQAVGDLAPGATAEVNVATAADPKNPNPAFFRLYNPSADFQAQPGKAPPVPTRDQIRKRMILDGAFEGALATNGQNVGLLFIGWTEQPLSEPLVTAGRISRANLALITQSLSFTPWQNGVYSLPRGLVAPTVSAQEGNEASWYPGGLNVANGSRLTLEFRLPDYRPMAIERVAFNATLDDPSKVSKTGATSAEVYNWARQTFEPLALVSGTDTQINSPSRYVSSAGVIRLRFAAGPGQWLSVQRLTVSAQGREVR